MEIQGRMEELSPRALTTATLAILGIDLSDPKSSHHQILLDLPDPAGAINRLSLLADRLNEDQLREDDLQIIRSVLKSPDNFKPLALLFSNSPILSRYFTKDPKKFIDLFPVVKVSVKNFVAEQNGILSELLITGEADDDKDAINPEEIFSAIRAKKARQFISITMADYLGLDGLDETASKITLFAETAVAYSLHYSGLIEFPLAVIAMGKLGGQELNYNSDIDLMFTVADNIEDFISPAALNKKIYRFIEILDRLTSDGFVFKVDIRIRPEGDQGPLFMTLSQYRRYYQQRAQSWEFQALIKARAVGGDDSVGKVFMDFRNQFVFSPDFSSKKMLFSIARIKNTIETFHNSHGYDDVKLSPGGIRDLEFTVQFLQIHHGKITRILDSSKTLDILDKFLAYKLITPKQHRDFKNHYCFLRRIEHYLQLVDLQPVRRIPANPDALLILARMMGYDNPENFIARVKRVMNANRNLFVRIFNLTVAFYEKIEDIRRTIESWGMGKDNPYLIFFENHIGHLESDYYLNFSTPTIIEHIRLLKRLTENRSRLEMTVISAKGSGDERQGNDFVDKSKTEKPKSVYRISVNLVTYDHAGIFSLICALFSVHGISILNGASFLYQPSTQTEPLPQNQIIKNQFSSRLFWKKRQSDKREDTSKKVVFSMEGVFINDQACREFREDVFREDLLNTIADPGQKGYGRTMEGVLLRSIESLGKYNPNPPSELKPIQMKIDNDSHPLYTLIDIESEDSFLFLFFFTYALSYQGYYIIKVEFSTPKNRVRNRLFLTDQKREKVQEDKGFLNLKSSILIIKYFSQFMAYAPNPSLAYKTFNQLVSKIESTKSKTADFHTLFYDLAKVLGTGEVIMEDFLRLQHHDIRSFLGEKKEVGVRLTRDYLQKKMGEAFASLENYDEESVEQLNRFKDKYLFILDLRLLTGEIAAFEEFCGEMTTLTDTVMIKAVEIALAKGLKKFGLSREPGRHAIAALGKWGSREMGYASDVEMVFVYDGPGQDGKVVAELREFYNYVGNAIPGIIRSKKNGVFELDLRLRPEGEAGPIATSLMKYQNYYREGGGYLNYERMVLTRLRIVFDTGDLGKAVIDIQKRFLYEQGKFDIADYLSLRQKQIKSLVAPKTSHKSRSQVSQKIVNFKFSPGGLVEIEYLLQILSLRYGKDYPEVRKRDTLGIARGLFLEKLIDHKIWVEMQECYKFLRNLINCIRIIRGNAKDMVMPERDTLEMEYLKRTMVNFRDLAPDKNLYDEIQTIMSQVSSLHHRFIEN